MKSVLVIEDNTDIRENTVEILDLAGYKTFSAENGKKGVEMAFREKPDLVVCDIMMPVLDGYGVLHLLRKNEDTINIPFIFLTAKIERTDFRKGMEMGADDYITKPFEDIELLNAIEIRLKKSALLEKKYPLSQDGIADFLKDIKGAGLIAELSEKYNIEKYSKKISVYQEGRRPKFLYYLMKGRVKGYKNHEYGKEYITDIYSEGDFIGYSSLIENTNYTENTIVLEDAEILQIPREDFLQMIYKDINVANRFIRIITQNVKEKEERLLNLAYSSLRKRVAKALCDIHGKFNTPESNNPLEISRDDIAHYVGTATESLIRTLSDFKAEKLIEIKEGKIIITGIEKLNNLLY
jgi:CRP-like cAMP-binding protein/ActR/RegA family two-component response regulator